MAKRVLVVDDQEGIADTLAALLRNAGYDASAYYNAQSALVEVESRTPDLVITDIDMPGMNGVDMAILIRRGYPACKVLLFSGRACAEDLLEIAGTQEHDFELLAKPIHPIDLLARIAAVSCESKNTCTCSNRQFTPIPD